MRTRSGLIVPESREQKIRRINAIREKMESGRQTQQSEKLEKELRELDDRFRVIFVDPVVGQLPPALRAPGMIPGRWHIKLLTEPRVTYFPIAGPNWEYREPESAVVEEMKARDLWRRGALEERLHAQDREEEAQRRREATEAEARIEQTAFAYRAAKRVFGDGGETKNFIRKRRGEGLKRLILPTGVRS